MALVVPTVSAALAARTLTGKWALDHTGTFQLTPRASRIRTTEKIDIALLNV